MYNNTKILIGKILKETHISLGFTQEEVAEKIGLAPRYISDIERDKEDPYEKQANPVQPAFCGHGAVAAARVRAGQRDRDDKWGGV